MRDVAARAAGWRRVLFLGAVNLPTTGPELRALRHSRAQAARGPPSD